MRYQRSIAVICEECGVTQKLGDSSVQTALEWVLSEGWVGLTSEHLSVAATRVITLDDVLGEVRVIRSVEDLDDAPAKRIAIVCPQCSDSVVARRTTGAQRKILAAIERLEAEVAALKAQVAS